MWLWLAEAGLSRRSRAYLPNFGPTRTNRMAQSKQSTLLHSLERRPFVYGPSITAVSASDRCVLIKAGIFQRRFPNHTLSCLYGRSRRISSLSFHGVWGKGESFPSRPRNNPQCGVRRLQIRRAKAREEDRPLSYPLAVATLPIQLLGSYEYRKCEGISLLFSVLIEAFISFCSSTGLRSLSI